MAADFVVFLWALGCAIFVVVTLANRDKRRRR
jgi:hypothetical protein